MNSEHYQNYDERYDLIMNCLNIMGYSAINPGPWDLYSSSRFVEKTCKDNRIPLVSANVIIPKPKRSCIKKYFIKEINGIKIGVTGISPQQDDLRPPDKRFSIIDPKQGLNRIIPDLVKKTDFIILLSQLKTDATLEILTNFPDIDLAMCASTIPTDIRTLSDHRTMTITNRGRQIGMISIEKTKHNNITIKNKQIITLGNDIDSDPIVRDLVSAHYEQIRRQQEEKKQIEIFNKEKKFLELTPEEFIKLYNKERKK